jgi:GTP-binding protein
VNFFLVNERFVLADLPGYGFAVGPEAERRAWGPLVEHYLRERPTLRGVVILVDVRRGVEAEEAELLAFLASVRLPSVLVATKCDKLGRGAARQALARLTSAGVPALGYSARTGEGRDALFGVLAGWLAGPPRSG